MVWAVVHGTHSVPKGLHNYKSSGDIIYEKQISRLM